MTNEDAREFVKVIRDPVHDYVGVPNELLPLIDHPFVQRLRRISQTAMSSSVYPSMNGRRFEHSLGAMHLAYQGWIRTWSNTNRQIRTDFRDAVITSLQSELDDTSRTEESAPHLLSEISTDEQFARIIAIAVGAAALLHDVGHAPYSHTLEDLFKAYADWIIADCGQAAIANFDLSRSASVGRDFHEQIGILLASRLEPEVTSRIDWRVVSNILASDPATGTWDSALHDLVSGEVDVDRLDYLLRDTRNSGTEFGAFDKERLLQSLELLPGAVVDPRLETGHENTRWVIAFGSRATSALETFIINRYQYYRWVVYHYHTVIANRMLKHCVFYLLQLEKVTDQNGKLRANPVLSGAFLNYFVAQGDMDTKALNRQLALVDDHTIIEWIKRGISKFAQPAEQELDYERRARIRFQCLASAVLHRTTNWVPMWKTDEDYAQFCYERFGALTTVVESMHSRCKADTAPLRNGGLNRISAIRESFIHMLYDREDVPLNQAALPPESVPLLNSIAREIVGTSTEADGGTRFLREMNAAEYFTRTWPPVDGHPDGFWIFAYDEIKPWRVGDEAAQISRNKTVKPLSEQSSSMLVHLERVELRRAQFHCYFVTPNGDAMRNSDSVGAITGRFRAHFNNFVYASLKANVED